MLSGPMETTVAYSSLKGENKPNRYVRIRPNDNTPLFQPSGIFKIIFKCKTKEI